jgi:hypothetical protein
MAALIKRRLGAVRVALAELQGKSAHCHVSKIQAAAVCKAIVESELDVDERADCFGSRPA